MMESEASKANAEAPGTELKPPIPDYTQVLQQIANEIAGGFDQLCQVLDRLAKREAQGRG